jgi:periplasmic divalent cation tolerance protein
MEKPSTNYQLLISTCPNLEVAKQIAQSLLENHLAACVNLLPNVQSMFVWKNEITSETEVLLLIKTHRTHYAAIEHKLLQLHPYQVPELIGVPIEVGLPKYLAWLDEVVNLVDSG